MLYFESKNITYAVRFVRISNSTFAELFEVTSNKGLRRTHLVGEVRLFYRDTFVSLTGKKQALARLLDRFDKHIGKLSKEDRQKIWKSFVEEFGK